MKRVIQYSFYLLAFLLPVATLLSQYFLNRIGLPAWTVLWKEFLVVIILATTLLSTIIYFIRNQDKLKIKIQKTWPVLTVFSATAVVLLSSLIFKPPLTNLVFGFRFELFWLWLFAAMVSYKNIAGENGYIDRLFITKLKKYIYYGFYVVLIITALQLVIGQENVLSFFGFGSNDTSGFLTKAPLAHVIDGGGINDSLRLSGPFSTPNHFAAYLIMVGGLFVGQFLQNRTKKDLFLVILSLLLIILSFARFSWLGVFMIFSFGLVLYFSNKFNTKLVVKKSLLYLTLIVPVFVGLVAINLPYENLSDNLPSFLSKPSSTILHRRHTMASLEVLQREPARLISGFGLGVSGPGAKDEYSNIYENPLVIKYGDDIPYKWFLVERDLLIPENWFLQVLINGGLLYLFLYCLVVFIPLWWIIKSIHNDNFNKKDIEVLLINLAMFGIIVGNFFLHIWENQTVAIYWTIIWLMQFDNRDKIET